MKHFMAKLLAILLIATMLPLTAYADDSDLYYNELTGSIVKIDRYDEYARNNYLGDGPTWAKCRDGEIGNFKFWIDYWMSHYGYVDAYFEKTLGIVRLFYQSKYLSQHVASHEHYITDFMSYASRKMGSEQFVAFMENLSPDRGTFITTDIIYDMVKSAWAPFLSDNFVIKKAWSSVLNGKFSILGDYKVSSIRKRVLTTLASRGLAELMYSSSLTSHFDDTLTDGEKSLYKKLSGALISGNGFSYIDFFLEIPRQVTSEIDAITNRALDGYTEEMRALDLQKVNAKYNYALPAVLTPHIDSFSFDNFSDAEYVELTADVIEELDRVLTDIEDAESMEALDEILKGYCTVIEDSATVTDSISLSMEGTEFFPEPAQNIDILQGDSVVTDQFNITSDGVFGVTITPKKTVAPGVPYTIVQTNRFHTTVRTVQYPKSSNSALTKVRVKLQNGSTKDLTFTDFEASVAGLAGISKVWLADSTATYTTILDEFGNAQIRVTAQNGLHSSVYVVKNINSIQFKGEDVYTAKVIKTSGYSLQITCENIPPEHEKDLYAVVYTADNRMSQVIPYSEDAFSRITYPAGGNVKLLYMDVGSVNPLANVFSVLQSS